MHDFAAAAMLRLVQLGLARQGLGAPVPPAGPQGALVPLQDKRERLLALWQQHGAGVVLRLGEGVHDAPDEPTLLALTLARDPHDLLRRWQRLERFIHSRHRVVTLHAGADALALAHVSTREGEPPHPAEDHLVLGVLVGLLARIGTTGLEVELACGGQRWQQEAWHAAPPVRGGDSARWTLRWRGAQPRPGAPEAATGAQDALAACRALVAADLARIWTLADAAAALHLPARSVQRRLAAQGSSFTGLCMQARLAHAAHLLACDAMPPAQVGYVCGFADQAHFTRAFRRHTAITPARYRERFAQSARPPAPATRSPGPA